jgi:hypothetical protein
MIQTSTRKKCGNCKHFELSPPAAPTSKSTYMGRCKRPDWPHATSIGKTCPGYQAREDARKHTPKPEPVQRVHALLWAAFGALAEHRYPAAVSSIECALTELRRLIARREVRK